MTDKLYHLAEKAVEELERLAKAATPGPWDTDTEQNEGSYGMGEDVSEGFDSYGVYAGDKKVVDTLNSDLAEVEVDGDCDENGPRSWAWDEQGRRNAEFIAAANPQAILALIKEKREMEEALRGIYVAHGWYKADCPNNEHDPVYDAIETAKANFPLTQPSPGEST